MWRFCVLVAGCSFTPGALGSDASPGFEGFCTAVARWPILTGGAPPGYTLTVDISEALAVASADELHVLADGVELDRVIAAPLLDVKVPAAGALVVELGASGTAPADPANVYLFAESFDTLAVGDNGSSRFAAQPTTDWAVADDTGAAGNRVFHALGAGRHPAAIAGLMLADGDIRGRIRVGPGGGQQHNGLAARGNNMDPTTMDGFVGQLMADIMRTRIAEYNDGASPPPEITGVDRPVARNTWYALRLRFVGDLVELFIDGVPALTTTKSGSDGRHVGIYAHDTDVDFDDLTVRMAIEPAPVALLGPRGACP